VPSEPNWTPTSTIRIKKNDYISWLSSKLQTLLAQRTGGNAEYNSLLESCINVFTAAGGSLRVVERLADCVKWNNGEYSVSRRRSPCRSKAAGFDWLIGTEYSNSIALKFQTT
jgi:hypothetical protein